MMYMGSFAGTNHPMYILYTGSKMKVGTLLLCVVLTDTASSHTLTRDHASTRADLSSKSYKTTQIMISRANSREGYAHVSSRTIGMSKRELLGSMSEKARARELWRESAEG